MRTKSPLHIYKSNFFCGCISDYILDRNQIKQKHPYNERKYYNVYRSLLCFGSRHPPNQNQEAKQTIQYKEADQDVHVGPPFTLFEPSLL